MDSLWLLKADPTAPGWAELEKGAKDKTLDWVLFDRDAWVLLRAAEPPAYDGFVAVEPPDGIYVDQQGNSVCVVGRKLVRRPEDVIDALGDRAKELLAKLGDPVAVLERLGRAY
jgi:hypothetical protein